MASEAGTSFRLAGSARLIGIAATFSMALHLLALTALGGFLQAPTQDEQATPLRAVLVALEAAEPAATLPLPVVTKPTPRLAPAKARTIEIVEASASDAPLVIARSIGRMASTPAIQSSLLQENTVSSLPQTTQPDSAPDPTVAQREPVVTAPRRIFIEYELKSSIADGRARYLWTADVATRRYTIEGGMEADGFFASMFAGRFEQESNGELVASGLKPARFSLRRGEAQAEVARFDWEALRIEHRRIRGEHVQPLTSNAQDLQSFLFQFDYEFKRPVAPERVSFAITNARKLDLYEFRVAGRERLKLSLGDIETIHLVRVAEDAGDAYEAWLSPAHHYLPVKIRFMLSGRFPVDQLATRIDIEP